MSFKQYQRITLIMAMEQEAQPLIEQLGLVPLDMQDPVLPCRAYSGKYQRLDVSLVINGTDPIHGVQCIGTQAATLAAREAIMQFQPDLLLNAGTCGAFKDKGSNIGDVYLGDRIRYFDRRVPINDAYQNCADGNYLCEHAITLAKTLNMPTAVVCTGNSIDMSPTDESIIQKEPIVAKEMEAAAIAWIASLYNVPLVALKSVTDLMDGGESTTEEFQKNLAMASGNLAKAVVRLLEFLAGQQDTSSA
ncbi:MAG: hypothetical protein ACR2PT_13430 [Endozoicomonas sp.]